MTDGDAKKPPGPSTSQILKLIFGILIFAGLMGMRLEFEQVWLRALVAACAGGILAWAILQAKRSRN